MLGAEASSVKLSLVGVESHVLISDGQFNTKWLKKEGWRDDRTHVAPQPAPDGKANGAADKATRTSCRGGIPQEDI